ncbi:hypothetical protein ACFXKW_23770 [Streptomyces sp. NPDC059193]|uniref:hypothetical protein n=1 Tax=Streptomyces sp. NPDC059193 TaxID=3346763 RepID=UPI00368FF489
MSGDSGNTDGKPNPSGEDGEPQPCRDCSRGTRSPLDIVGVLFGDEIADGISDSVIEFGKWLLEFLSSL